jgi:ABC-type transport system involved in multi-copper enzyme maturation permease subunit
MGLFWFLVGAVLVAGACLFGRSFTRRGTRARWYDWSAAGVLYLYWIGVCYFVVISVVEKQVRAAGTGFAIFGAFGLALVVAYRLLAKRLPNAAAKKREEVG